VTTPAPTTPSGGTPNPRAPAPSGVLLEQALQRSEVPRSEVPLVTHERVRVVEQSVDRLHDHVADLRAEMRANTRVSARGTGAAQAGAYLAAAWPTLVIMSKVLGAWGDAHPGADVGLTAAILLVARVIAQMHAPFVRSDARPGEPPPGPPP
jgi:hypothetical protein